MEGNVPALSMTEAAPRFTRGPWVAHAFGGTFYVFAGGGEAMVADSHPGLDDPPHIARIRGVGRGASEAEQKANAALIAAAPGLLAEAQVLRCLASSPRFQHITVAEALEELAANGCGHDGGAAIAKAEGRS